MYRSLTLVAFAAYASAQSLSSSCNSAIQGLIGDPDATACLSLTSLIPFLSLGPNDSIVQPVDKWLTSVCAAPACSNTTIAAVVQNVTAGCSSDLSALGVTSSIAPALTSIVQQFYPTVRQVLCLKNGNTNCITQTLTGAESVLGPITLGSAEKLATTNTDLPNNVTCTDCVKAIYNVINTAAPSVVSDAAPSLQSQCGASFTDGNTPSDITQSASDLTSSGNGNNNNKAGATTHGALAGFGAVISVVTSTFFAVLV